ncbi:hypothetical protein [Nocardia wallacei]|uniref:hypothetical protein n=1 Tax=Nocardia wallacei TaxID=480035 RepID=UPI002458141B|nr:hypothetical protein [Nocardia wallacei]
MAGLPLLPGFGEPLRYSAVDAAAAVGIPLVQARQYWRALGYPATGDTAVAFGASDVQLLRTISGYVSENVLTEADTLRLTRVLTRAIAHLAHLQVEILASQRARARAGGIDVVEQMMHRMPEVQRVLGQIWVRQLSGGEPTRIVGRFEFRSTQVIFESGGSVVKTLGDEVLFTAHDAAAVADIATRLIAQFAAHPDFRLTTLPDTEIRGVGTVAPVVVDRR